jgi:16S rRNA (cytosine1402-N4)-methyltransferase
MTVGAGGAAGDSEGEQVRAHQPVLLAETLAALDLRPGLVVVDGTVGAGGHARAIASAISPGGLLVGLDRDARVLDHARQALEAPAPDGRRVAYQLHHASFEEMREVLLQSGLSHCDRVLLDLGVSSFQLDERARGFSFMGDGPLDMRMDTASHPTAAEWLQRVSAADLERVLREFGEERYARRIARAIVDRRARGALQRTAELAELVLRALPPPARRQRIHPATRTFQAIRIAVNDELGRLQRGLAVALATLVVGGRLVVISFHSLEDRITKTFLRAHCTLPFRKPIVAGASEVAANPRARSAKLRCGIRTAAA